MLWAVIMAGGSGTRFWPESRQKKPKQLLNIFGRKTLLEQTFLRLKGGVPKERVLVVCQDKHAAQVRRLLKIDSRQIIGEPVGRNTAPCAVLAAATLLKKDPHAVLAFLPADHLIENQARFRKVLKTAGDLAERTGQPVTFGVRPAFPHTGFGYLEMGRCLHKGRQGLAVYHLKRFREKPGLRQARAFVKSRRFLWNSGMFVWRADQVIRTARRYHPGIYQLAQKITSGPAVRTMKTYFPKMKNISIDYAFMEPLKGKILTIPVDFGWNDLGGWQVLPEIWSADNHGNVCLGSSMLHASRGNIVSGRKRLIALVGVNDLVVVDTEDAVLVCDRRQTERIREAVQALSLRKKWHKYL